LTRCACRVVRRRCTSQCHGGRGNNELRAMHDDLEKSSNDEDESTKEDVTPSEEVSDLQPIT